MRPDVAFSDQSDGVLHGTVQILDIKAMTNGRYRCVIFDGAKQMTSMPASQLSESLQGGQIVENSIVRMGKVQSSDVGNAKYVVCSTEMGRFGRREI
jgi:hypothetical protein